MNRYLFLSFVLLFLRISTSFRQYSKLRIAHSHLSILNAELRILIHGTKNAYTTIRQYDVLLYNTDDVVEGATKRLGVLSSDKNVLPLCSFGEDDLYIDEFASPLNAELLYKEGKLLRVVSSDRRGTDCFLIEEYLGNEVYIPVKSRSVTTDNKLMTDLPCDSGDDEMSCIESEIQFMESKLTFLKNKREKIKVKSDKYASRESLSTSNAPAALGPYSQAIRANGMIFVSGCIGLSPVTNQLVGDTIEAQTTQALDNIAAILTGAGSSLRKVCKTTIMVSDISVYPVVNAIYGKYFPKESDPPARSTFAVSALPAGALVEIEAIALQ